MNETQLKNSVSDQKGNQVEYRKRPTAAQHAADMADYMEEGRALALTLNNRGPLRFAADGALHPNIRAAYWTHGFYVFEDVIDQVELEELRTGVNDMVRRAPVAPGAKSMWLANRRWVLISSGILICGWRP